MRAASGATAPLRITGTGLNLADTPAANSTGTPASTPPRPPSRRSAGTRATTTSVLLRRQPGRAGPGDRRGPRVPDRADRDGPHAPRCPTPGHPATGRGRPGSTTYGLLYIITVLASGSALFLIAATMNTLIAEQAREIAILKALGGRRLQIGGITARTARDVGRVGAIAGAISVVAVAILLAHYFAERFVDVLVRLRRVVPGDRGSLVARRCSRSPRRCPPCDAPLRRPVAETLTGADTDGGYGTGWLDRTAARAVRSSDCRQRAARLPRRAAANVGAASPRSRRSPSRPGWRSRPRCSASRSTP